jgi:hypothetical protein
MWYNFPSFTHAAVMLPVVSPPSLRLKRSHTRRAQTQWSNTASAILCNLRASRLWNRGSACSSGRFSSDSKSIHYRLGLRSRSEQRGGESKDPCAGQELNPGHCTARALSAQIYNVLHLKRNPYYKSIRRFGDVHYNKINQLFFSSASVRKNSRNSFTTGAESVHVLEDKHPPETVSSFSVLLSHSVPVRKRTA